jgi:hypothetical protein
MKTNHRGIQVILSAADRKRVEAMADRSEIPLAHWVKLAIMSACSTDEAHWAEMERREQTRQVLVKRLAGVGDRL